MKIYTKKVDACIVCPHFFDGVGPPECRATETWLVVDDPDSVLPSCPLPDEGEEK